ncbi:MAG TPA: hypothetical protein VGB65_06920, partial [Allosphingosinicella sp.]
NPKLVALAFLACSSAAAGQTIPAANPPSHGGWLKVTSSRPIGGRCQRSRGDCFRVVISAASATDDEVEVMAVSEVNSDLHEATGFSDAGAVCEGTKLGGLPLAESTYDMSLRRHGEPAIVSAASPGRIVVEYSCDSSFGPGQSVSWNIVLAVQSDNGELIKGSYTFPDTPVQTAPR